MFLPTYNECQKIVENNEAFKEKIEVIDGTKVSIFNYLLAGFEDFNNPLGENNSVDAFELRGITFVHNENTVDRYLMLHKFFNLDQTIGYMTVDVSGKEISSIQDKRDGTMVRFIKVNGKVIPKTKMSLSNDQTELATKIYEENEDIRNFINETLDNDLAAIFELTSPFNRIVLKYPSTELKLIQLRSETNGTYYDIYNNELVKKHNIELTDSYEIQELEEIVSIVKRIEDFNLFKKNKFKPQ